MSASKLAHVEPAVVTGATENCTPPSTRLQAARHQILIVEDELWAALDIEWVVIKLGAEVLGPVATAEEAIEYAETSAPDLVLMDIRLAGERDGVDAAIEINKRWGIRSLFLSAHVDAETRARAAPAQPLGFIDKPFTPEALARAISDALGHRKANH